MSVEVLDQVMFRMEVFAVFERSGRDIGQLIVSSSNVHWDQC